MATFIFTCAGTAWLAHRQAALAGENARASQRLQKTIELNHRMRGAVDGQIDLLYRYVERAESGTR